MADFQAQAADFEQRNVKLVAASIDSEEDALAMAKAAGTSFPIGYGLDGEQMAERYGAFIDGEKKFLHATGFLLRPDGTIANAVYSTGPIGRFGVGETLRIIDYYQKQG